MEFPTLLYRVPGIHRGPDNSTFNFIEAVDEDRFDELIGEGWFETLSEALEPAPAVTGEPSDRALLEAEAKRLGIGFNWKTSDGSLTEKIEAARVAE